jgi:protein-tyrosine phosphatase
MAGFVDLHCHCLPGIDDGVRTVDEGTQLLRELSLAGFGRVVATPHMRPGMFDTTSDTIRSTFGLFRDGAALDGLPELDVGSEHYFDDVVERRLKSGEGVLYPGGKAALIELYDMDFGSVLRERLFGLRRLGILPVIAHPERYRPLWSSPARLEKVLDDGAVALLDLAALVGKYGKETQRCAEALFEEGLYAAACSDAHRPADVADVVRAIRLIERRYGPEEATLLLQDGPEDILVGTVPP